MSEHTPGPWHTGCLGSDSTCQCANVCDEGFAGGICTIHVGNGLPIGEGGNDAPPREQAIANMHLIATAPELLQIAKDLIEEDWPDCKFPDWFTARAKAAISKATGSA